MPRKRKVQIIEGQQEPPPAPVKYRTFQGIVRRALSRFYKDFEIDDFELRPPELWTPKEYGGTITVDLGVDSDEAKAGKYADRDILVALGFTVKVKEEHAVGEPAGEPGCGEIGPHWPGKPPVK